MISLEWVLGITLGWLFIQSVGAYAYTWKSVSRIWDAIKELQENELHHLDERVSKLESKLDRPIRDEYSRIP